MPYALDITTRDLLYYDYLSVIMNLHVISFPSYAFLLSDFKVHIKK